MTPSLTESFRTISTKYLLAVYLIVPAILLFVLVDIFLLDNSFQPYFGVETLFHPVFLFFFLLPHIAASWFSFFDTEYISHYRKHMLIYLPLLLLATGILLYFDVRYGLLFFFLNDVWHGVRQKVGIGLILGAKPGLLNTLWTVFPFVSASLVYVFLVLPEVIPVLIFDQINEILLGSSVALFCVTVLLFRRYSGMLRWYVVGVSGLFIVSYFFVLANYAFFAFLVFRFVHDASAFAFYITHDHNRNRGEYKNWFYKFFSFVPLPVFILTPVLGFLFAYLVRSLSNGIVIGQAIVILFCMSHFYLESVMWKHGTPHRKQVAVE